MASLEYGMLGSCKYLLQSVYQHGEKLVCIWVERAVPEYGPFGGFVNACHIQPIVYLFVCSCNFSVKWLQAMHETMLL